MYEDQWYSYVPEQKKKQEEISSNPIKHRNKKSLLQQPPNGKSSLQNESLLEIIEDGIDKRSPPQATRVKRAKSYSDFYDVCTSYFGSGDKKNTPPDTLELLESSKIDSPSTSCYDEYEDDIVTASQEEYQLYKNQLDLSERHLNGLLDDTTQALVLLAKLSTSFQTVETQTTAFQAQCEDLLAEQKRIRRLADEVSTDLQYYAYLEPLTKRLNTVTGSRLVRSDDFLDILVNLNTCIDFMDGHPQYRDSMVYVTRYTSLLQKALTAAQTAVTLALREVADDVTKELKAKDHNDTAEYILLHGRYESVFEDLGTQLKSLLTTEDFAFGQKGDELSQSSYAPQYHQLFRQLVDAYVRSREPVTYVVSKNLQKFAGKDVKEDAEFKIFVRRCVQYVFDICQNEQKLVDQFFHGGPILTQYPGLSSWNIYGKYTESLEANRLSHIRTLNSFIISYLSKENLSRVCDLVSWLESTYLAPAEGEEDMETPQMYAALATSLLEDHLWPLSDALFIQAASEIQHFKPSPDDLQVIRIGEKSDAPTECAGDKETSGQTSNIVSTMGSSAATAFPTVKTAVSLLIMYNDSMYDRPKKGDVLYEIVHQATESLQRAATIIKRSTGIMVAQVFLIKNLMLIENLFMTHEIPDSVRQSAELDFTPIWETIRELQARKQLFNPLAYINPIVQGHLLPAVVDRVLDARKELEKVLVQQITAFTKHWKGQLIGAGKRFDAVAKSRKDLEALLDGVFQDETTKAALWKMIRSDDSSY
ncbi:Sec34-like family-domain-containing protein [Calycina marina]|uniref:Conserved oligomeric Golgi complex subunit 3 n=1 Tax=Calycina marina TaxID=1763456 RepID=A0A9P7Z0C1_9HELO|nr:Sec34-like family-domain-containing protein [Calycina marina]